MIRHDSFRRIFFATDFSACSEEGLRRAIGIAKEARAELVIAHVHQAATSLPMDGYLRPAAHVELDATLRDAAEKRLRVLAEAVRKQGINVRLLVLAGTPHEAIVNAAREAGADLLVIGTHGRTGAARFFLGSVAARVISDAPCPVLTVRVAGES